MAMAEYSTDMSTDSSWRDLLQRNGLTPVKPAKTALRISESTPKVNSGQSRIKDELMILRAEKERQGELLEKLTTDNSRLISQVERFRIVSEKLEGELSESRLEHDRMAASLALAQLTATELEKGMKEKDEALQSLLSHVQSLQDEVQQLSGLFQQHGPNKPLISDLERLTVHNAELCDRLAATQHSRTILEREVLSLKRKLLEEKTVNGRLDQLLRSSDRERTAMKEQMKQLVSAERSNAGIEALAKEKMELSEQVKERERELGELKEAQVLQTKLRHRELESLKQQLEGQLVTMEAQLENRNKEVAVMEGELASKMAAKESELERVKEERAQLQEQLGKSQALSQQLMAEKHAYQQRMQQMSKQLESECSSSARIHQQLEKASSDLEASLGDLEASRIANMLLKQQVGDLEGQLDSVKEQLRSRLELTNEMKVLLDQRAQRIRQLEKTLSKKREELDVSMETVSELLNASRDSEDALSVSSSVVLSTTSPVHRVNSRTRFTSSQAEVVHLKQRLSESRQASVRLEMKLATLKTENAKLLGSQQALNAIREQLSQENSRLSNREREMDSHWQREREKLTNQLNSITAEAEQLKAQLAQQKEELLLRVEQLEEESALQELSVESQARLEHVEREVWQLTSLLEQQNSWVHKQIELCKGETEALQTEVREIEEGTKLTEAVNSATQLQLQRCESSVCELIGEVEILRARKTVLMKYAHEQLAPGDAMRLLEQNRKLEKELTEARALLQHYSCNQLSREQSCDQSCEQSQVSERGLKWRLRCQTRQTNYCRVKLGYALSELRLYKELKVAMETHIAELQASVASLECRYEQCVQRLQQAEALGFTA